jgi:hypothetical protein
MIAEISSGNVDTADVFFLIALILFVIAAVSYATRRYTPHAPAIVASGLACVALALFVL